MRNLTFFETPLTMGTGEGMATTDPRFAQVNRLADGEDLAAAADAASALIDEGFLDIRLVAHVLRAAFLESGVERLPEILHGLERMIRTSWDRIGPRERRELHLRKSLVWLFERMEGALSYHQLKRDAQWMTLEADAETTKNSLDHLSDLVDALDPDSQSVVEESASKLRRSLRELYTRGVADEEEAQVGVVESAPREPMSLRKIYFEFGEGGTVELKGSSKLRELIAKLAAFEELADRGDYRKAAMVAADVQATIEGFDPREYFPDLFASFGALLSNHIDHIAPHWDGRETVSWRMLEQFYRVDLEAFVEDDR